MTAVGSGCLQPTYRYMELVQCMMDMDGCAYMYVKCTYVLGLCDNGKTYTYFDNVLAAYMYVRTYVAIKIITKSVRTY